MRTVILEDGDAVDLDSGVVSAGGALDAALIDLRVVSKSLHFGRPRKLIPAFSSMVTAVSDAPWSQMTTDTGRLAAVQVLHTAAPIALRYVVAPPGMKSWRRAPCDAHCIGREDSIEVWFDEDSSYAAYRIERRVGSAGPFVPAKTIDRPPFVDSPVSGDTRMGYRICGVTSDGETSIPAEVQGTTRSRGVFSASVIYKPAERERCWFDLLRGEVGRDRGDLRFMFSAGGWTSAGFTDSEGHEVTSFDVADQGQRSRWDVPLAEAGVGHIPMGAPFFVDLAGGGVARCTVRPDPESPRGRDWTDFRIDYVVNPDGPCLEPRTTLNATKQPDGRVRIELSGLPTFVLGDVEVRGPDGAVLRRIVAGGSAVIDAPPAGETYRAYIAAARDARGRAAATGRLLIDDRPATPRSGVIEIGWREGYSFAADGIVPLDDADLALVGAAGGLNSAGIEAPLGIASVRTLTDWSDSDLDRHTLLQSIAAIDAPRIAWRRQDWGDARTPECDVFVLRCRSGGWARFCIDERRDGGIAAGRAVVLRYTFNPREPVFDAKSPVVQVSGGLQFNRSIRVGPLSRLPGGDEK